MNTYKITFKIVRSFSLGITIHSPKLNGLSIEIRIAWFGISLWSKGHDLLTFKNFWTE